MSIFATTTKFGKAIYDKLSFLSSNEVGVIIQYAFELRIDRSFGTESGVVCMQVCGNEDRLLYVATYDDIHLYSTETGMELQNITKSLKPLQLTCVRGMAVHNHELFMSFRNLSSIVIIPIQPELIQHYRVVQFHDRFPTLKNPYGLAANGVRIFVCERDRSMIHVLNTNNGNFVQTLHFSRPTFCYYHQKRLYVLNDSPNVYVIHPRNGTILKRFGAAHLKQPVSLAINSHSQILVCDQKACQVVVFDLEGGFLFNITMYGTPTEMSIDKQDRIYVNQNLHSQINRYDI